MIPFYHLATDAYPLCSKLFIIIIVTTCTQAAESEMCPSFSAAMKAGKPVYTDAQPSLADGLAVPMVSQ